MAETWTGTKRGKSIQFQSELPIADGAQVLVNVELVTPSSNAREKVILDLAGSWKDDPSLVRLFEEIQRDRQQHTGREVPLS